MLSETQSLKLTGSPSLLLPPCPFPTRRAELNGEQTAKKVKERVFLSIQSHRSIFDALALFPSLLTTSSLPHISPCSSHCPPPSLSPCLRHNPSKPSSRPDQQPEPVSQTQIRTCPSLAQNLSIPLGPQGQFSVALRPHLICS